MPLGGKHDDLQMPRLWRRCASGEFTFRGFPLSELQRTYTHAGFQPVVGYTDRCGWLFARLPHSTWIGTEKQRTVVRYDLRRIPCGISCRGGDGCRVDFGIPPDSDTGESPWRYSLRSGSEHRITADTTKSPTLFFNVTAAVGGADVPTGFVGMSAGRKPRPRPAPRAV